MSPRGSAPRDPGFSTLREYALVADGARGALIGPDGALVWMCFPDWHSDAVFSSILGGAGHYAVTPDEPFVWGGHYEPASLIWRSRWVTRDAIVECREALAAPPRAGRAVVLRRVVAEEGRARVDVHLGVRAAFGSQPVRDLTRDDRGTWHGRSGSVRFRWSGAPEASVTGEGDLELRLVLDEGATRDLVLELLVEEASSAEPTGDASQLWARTEAHWRERVPELEGVHARRDAQHSYAVLAGLTSASGGMVAAATTSLPERAESGRSYDYRYVWMRDQAYTGEAVAASGGGRLLDDAVRFVVDRLLDDGERVQPAYTVHGDRIPPERHVDLPGYPGGRDIVGNRVCEQFQLDVFGEALSLLAAAARLGRLPSEGWRAAEIAARAVQSRHDEPDAGVWELEPRRWTHSRLACVGGLRAMSALDDAPRVLSRGWNELAERLLDDTWRTSGHPSGRWQRAPDDPRPDAALLLASLRGALPPDDPRSIATHHGVLRELSSDGYLYRFRHGDQPLADAEGAFLLCGFWMAQSFSAQGDPVEAARWFERNRSGCGPPGLFAEEFDVVERQLRGNLPQAFVHALLLECAATLSLDRDPPARA